MNTSDVQAQKRRYGIVGNSEGLNHAVDIALQVAKTDLSVLITGESGVGKEIIPRIIHDNSLRKTKKYFAVNCGSIPEGTIDSELFGHEKGAFTGAIGEREGYFGAANGGTLFLDEVGELPLATQARLLRVLETGEYIRVGSSDVRKTDVRIVAATNVNMAQAIRDGRFREDLFYRLNTIPVKMPALRERGDDVVLRNDVTELKKLVHGQRVERERSSAPQVVEQPITYYQPDITYPVAHAAKGADEFQTPEEYVEEAVSLNDVERQMIVRALEKNRGKRRKAAQELNISERTLYRKIKEYGLDKEDL